MNLARSAYRIRNQVRSRLSLKALTIAVSALLLGACGPGGDDSAPLAYVPAQTPYVFANIEPMDEGIVEAYTKLIEPVRAGYAESLQRIRDKLAKSGDDSEESRKILSVMELFEDKLSIEGWEKIGFSRNGRFAFYGVGVLPVMRIELANPDALRGFVAEIETRAGEKFPVAEIEGHNYWRFAPGSAEGKDFAFVAAIIDKHLVLTLDPGVDVAPLADLVGLNKPAESLQDSGELTELNSKYGYGPHGTALIDSHRLVAAMLGADGQETWFTRKMAEEGKVVTPACRSEFSAMAANVPRLVSGYTQLNASEMNSAGVLELKPAIAQALLPIAAPVPGLGNGQGPVAVDFGYGVKLDKLAEFMQAQAAAIRAQPYACEWLAPMNKSAEEVGQQMAGLYMAGGWFTGLRAVLTDLSLSEDNEPERVEGGLVLASPNPAGLIGMLKGFVPQLAQVELVAGAEPKAISLAELGAGENAEKLPPTFAALTDSAIGLGFGSDGANALKGYLAAPAANPPPLLYVRYSGAFYADIMDRVEQMTQQSAASAMTESEHDFDLEDPAQSEGDIDLEIEESEDDLAIAAPAVPSDSGSKGLGDGDFMQHALEPLMSSINGIYRAIDYTTLDLTLTEKGVEMRQVMRLRD